MIRIIEAPVRVAAAGTPPKIIEEFVGRVATGDAGISVAHMISPRGWSEPGQRPEFREITVVLRGMLRVEHESGTAEIAAGQAVIAEPGDSVRYSSPGPEGAEYIAICLPAFSPDTVHRED